MSTESSKRVERRALTWLARQESGSWSEAEQNEFGEWLRADTAHRVAFLRLETGWERTARLKAFGVGKEQGVVPAPGEWRGAPFFKHRPASSQVPAVGAAGAEAPIPIRPRKWLPKGAAQFAGIAAGILMLAGAGLYLPSWVGGKAYTTPIGAITSIPLSDGSTVTLNTGSKLRVDLGQKERRIELEAGEAFFDVARDAARPFVVLAGERKITAVGTRFSVRREGADVQVIVTEGKVRVESGGSRGARLLAAGTAAHAVQQDLVVQEESPREAEEALSWRSGYLTFDKTALADAVAEFNRYTPRRIVIDDPQLAALEISGKFRATYAEDFVQVLKNGFGVQVRQGDDGVHLAAR